MKPEDQGIDLAFSYLRYSSTAQADGDSIRRQEAMRDAWLKKHPKVRLDTSLVFVDRASSGFTGENRLNPTRALAQFLSLVGKPRVPVGSYLIVENLDRLTRENPLDSIPVVLNLVKAGIRIVQLVPFEAVYDLTMEQGQLLLMLGELSRGHGESKRKSTLLAPIWAEKKRLARDGVPYGANCPAWLELRENEYVLSEDRKNVVRLIFRLSAEGHGYVGIVRRLQASGIPHFVEGRTWQRGYIARILRSRATLGEYQPHKGRKHRVPDGEPIADYFPAAVTEAEWYAAQKGIRARHHATGRPGRRGRPTSPFAGFLWDAAHRCKLHVKKWNDRETLVPAKVMEATNDLPGIAFPLNALVDGLLSQLQELSASQLFNDPGAERLQLLQGRHDAVAEKLRIAVERFDTDPHSPVWADRVSEYDRQQRELIRQLAEARQQAACPLSAVWSDAVEAMRRNEPDRLRAALVATVESVWCLFVPIGWDRIAAVQVRFRDSEQRRDYLIYSEMTRGCKAKERTCRWAARSLSDLTGDPFDLRDTRSAQALVKLLAKLDSAAFGLV